MIKSLNLEVTDVCNLQCRMCDIWQTRTHNYLSVSDIKNLLHSEYINLDTNITLTGGEPLLHKDLISLIGVLYSKGYKVSTLSTNGTLYSKIKELITHFEKHKLEVPNIHISIDGDEKTHDKQRGVLGSFRKSIETIILLKKEFHDISIKLKYTISKDNMLTIDYIYQLSKKLGVELSFKIVENDENYTNKVQTPALLDSAEKERISHILFNIYGESDNYINNLLYYLKNNALHFTCITPSENLFIMANGDVYPCTKYKTIGNIKNENIDDIIYNHLHKSLIDEVTDVNCSKCFSLHGAYKSII